VLDDRRLDRAREGSVRVGNDPGLVADRVEDVLGAGASISVCARAQARQGLDRLAKPDVTRTTRLTCMPPSPRNWLPGRNGTWITAPSLVSSLDVLASMSATPSK
jgi:hypothetical protein